jgi:hypothetical protein
MEIVSKEPYKTVGEYIIEIKKCNLRAAQVYCKLMTMAKT